MLKIVDGLREKPHVTSNDHFGRNEGIVGISDYVLNVGRLFETELISSNALRIYDGEGMIQGCHWRILPGTYETVTLRNGTQGKKRIDYVVARYEKNSVGYEDIGISVKEGEATSGNPKPPAYITGDIRAGDTIREMVLAEIEYEGINVVAVTPKFEVLMTMAELQEKTDELNRKLAYVKTDISQNLKVYREGRRVTVQGLVLINGTSMSFELPYTATDVTRFPTIGLSNSLALAGYSFGTVKGAVCEITFGNAITYAAVNFAYYTNL